MKLKRKSFIIFVATMLLLAWGCSQFPDSVKCTTGKTLTQVEIRNLFPRAPVIFGDTSYAEVNPAFSEKWHSYTSKVMDVLGMAPNWSQQFDCNRFALVKLAVIHIRFLVDTWHSRNPGQAPAAGELWYTPDLQPSGGQKVGHAILVTIEGGRKVYRDIYSSKELTLSSSEENSIWMVKF